MADNFAPQVLTDGFYHADPHSGNVFIKTSESGEHSVEWIDFGKVDYELEDLLTSVLDALQGGNYKVEPFLTNLSRGVIAIEGTIKTLSTNVTIFDLITGCNKNNQDDSLILGSWKGYSRSHIILKNGEPVSPADYLNDLIKAGIMEEPEDEDLVLRFEKGGKLTSIYEDETPIVQNLVYSIEGNHLIAKDPNNPSEQETMIIKDLTAKELVLGFNSEDSAFFSQPLVAKGYSVYHEISFRKIFLN